ncbi:lysozyme inhibitor LprI family protein [Mariniflexile sp. AS56]|uniref:lysozyme inhibitor LprI family protein n=1 Tax=Mariniflexile sp. AS56 TaxID=3063957 RepID=UPI0026F20E1C|nr:lysozyme inhibitor LprI family protein [Mariniflexile sp. AS56]MDO7172767.1 lysozyme inhibitor LprI family protein [Mariniflexile sp. AS56]
MYLKEISLSIIFIFTLNGLFGQSKTGDQIDLELKNCLESEKNYTTSAMTQCVIDATKNWDERLNETYQTLLKKLSSEQKKILVNAQKSWIAFRDNELAFSNKLYHDMQGTMWIPIHAETRLNLTRQRTLEIESYLDNIAIEN